MPSRPRIVTLTTDFGASDHFVGTMKGVILSIAPTTQIVDITHAVAPFNIAEAAFEIAQTWRYFPKGTIHVCIVDPGVGSTRRPILVEAAGHYFIGPDNGIFTFIESTAKFKIREITNPKVMLPQISRTFHGRDIFAPAAAHLAAGMPPARFGSLIRDAQRLPYVEPRKLSKNTWRGVILKTDRFSNLITNFHVDQFPGKVAIHLGRRKILMALTYADVDPGQLAVVVGSSGYLEIIANQAEATIATGADAGDAVTLEILP